MAGTTVFLHTTGACALGAGAWRSGPLGCAEQSRSERQCLRHRQAAGHGNALGLDIPPLNEGLDMSEEDNPSKKTITNRLCFLSVERAQLTMIMQAQELNTTQNLSLCQGTQTKHHRAGGFGNVNLFSHRSGLYT